MSISDSDGIKPLVSGSGTKINKVSKANLDDLSKQIDALPRALASERKEAQKFRDDVRAHLQNRRSFY